MFRSLPKFPPLQTINILTHGILRTVELWFPKMEIQSGIAGLKGLWIFHCNSPLDFFFQRMWSNLCCSNNKWTILMMMGNCGNWGPGRHKERKGSQVLFDFWHACWTLCWYPTGSEMRSTGPKGSKCEWGHRSGWSPSGEESGAEKRGG